jgi:hypothetical protein
MALTKSKNEVPQTLSTHPEVAAARSTLYALHHRRDDLQQQINDVRNRVEEHKSGLDLAAEKLLTDQTAVTTGVASKSRYRPSSNLSATGQSCFGLSNNSAATEIIEQGPA